MDNIPIWVWIGGGAVLLLAVTSGSGRQSKNVQAALESQALASGAAQALGNAYISGNVELARIGSAERIATSRDRALLLDELVRAQVGVLNTQIETGGKVVLTSLNNTAALRSEGMQTQLERYRIGKNAQTATAIAQIQAKAQRDIAEASSENSLLNNIFGSVTKIATGLL